MFTRKQVMRIGMALLAGAFVLSTTACKKKAPEKDKQAESAKIPTAEKLPGFKTEKICKLSEVLDDPEKGTPKHALLSLFKVWQKAKDAKWDGKDDAIFEEWRQLFVRAMQENKTVLLKGILSRLLSKRKIEHYVSSETGGIVICKAQETDKDKSWRFYVRNDQPKTSNKPVKVMRDGAAWKLDDGFLL